MSLCSLCSRFVTECLGREYIEEYYLHQPSFKSLLESSRECRLCRLIAAHFDDTNQTESILDEAENGYPTTITFVGIDHNGPWKYYPQYQSKCMWTELVGLMVCCGEAGRNDDWSCQFCLFTDHDDPAALSGDVVALSLSIHSGSTRSAELMRKWVAECDQTHVGCLPSSTVHFPIAEAFGKSLDTPLPTRLVDVGPSDGSHDPFLRVTQGESGKYATLSHCWGKTNHFTTTKETLAARKTGFTMKMLPKTFRDAIAIARSLDIRLLWIDSLCIIQDSATDWLQESACMADIYANCYLTIAATSSSDSSRGCLFLRERCQDVTVTYNTSSEAEGETSTGKVYIKPSKFTYIDPLRRAPLNSRSWVLQERLLSRRILHFAADQLYWDCHSSFLSEDNVFKSSVRNVSIEESVSGATNNPLRQSLRQLDFHGPHTPLTHPAFAWGSSVLGRWMSLVPEYTRRALTVPSDILPALAGIVQRVAARTGDTFLAGLWRSTLHIELLWMAYDAPHHAPRDLDGRITYRAPSWSWAALEGESEYYNYTDSWTHMRPDMKIVDAALRWEGSPGATRLLDARLEVEALLEPVRCLEEGSFDVLIEVKSFPLTSAQTATTDVERTQREDGREGTDRVYLRTWAVFDQEPPPTEQLLWFVCVTRRYADEYWGLILEEVEEQSLETRGGAAETKTFKRIGLGQIICKALLGNGIYTSLTLV